MILYGLIISGCNNIARSIARTGWAQKDRNEWEAIVNKANSTTGKIGVVIVIVIFILVFIGFLFFVKFK
jgi:uncharacterized membrane protein